MITTNLRGTNYKFETKPGLFSKDGIDVGSKLLIDNMTINPRDTVLDIGCGYGVMGLVAAKLAFKGRAYLVDTDIRAIKYSKINAKLNNVTNIEILPSDGLEGLPNLWFDVIISNPPSHLPKETMIGFIGDAKRQLKPSGKLYFVTEMRIKPLVQREFTRVFGNYETVTHNSKYAVSLATQTKNPLS